jgi:hypothetical protein
VPTLDELGLSVDLRVEPWRYPGLPLPFPALQVGEELLPLSWERDTCVVAWPGGPLPLDTALSSLAAPVMSERRFVLAVGSNKSPRTLLTKFSSAGVSTVIPSVPTRIRGIGVGHSAHVSVPGFIAAAPFRTPGVQADAVISALDDAQLDCLDTTEPSYVRVAFTAESRESLDTWARRIGCGGPLDVYVSRHGVIGDRRGGPIPCADQGRLLGLLVDLGVLANDLVDAGIPSAAAALRADPDLREQVRRRLSPFAVGSGFAQPD